MSYDEIKILLVEDDPDDIYLLKNYLTSDYRSKYRFENYSSLEACEKALSNNTFHIVILDLGLKDSQGLDTLKKFLSFGLKVPILVLTGINSEELGEKSIQLGAEDYLPKSILSTPLLTKTIKYSIERFNLHLKIKEQANEDYLTGLPNRKNFIEKLETLMHQSLRSSVKMALVMMDLDGFKKINDTYGHQAGDQLLISFALRLKKSIRISDAVSRFGGDEFCMLLTNYKDNDSLLDFLTKKQRELSLPYSLTLGEKTLSFSIGVSMGVAEWHNGLEVEELISIADNALYDSKRTNKGGISFG
ncbi:diguanylate cyclase domain-containing protein [Aliikangiella maris]|uniref:Diguanylate cyclase response regulator n=2 Tax=Aliikangiella maris TaxID=3162458 RepID=A0ABV2BWB2_9GAMM